jgi:hypothetical protein
MELLQAPCTNAVVPAFHLDSLNADAGDTTLNRAASYKDGATVRCERKVSTPA